MKFKSILASIFAASILVNSDSAHAGFSSALEEYAAQNYESAFDEFLSMAQLGEKRSQFNLGVMYFHGQGVEKDKYAAFAWIKLATESEILDDREKRIFDAVKKSIDNKDKAEKVYQKLSQKYSSSVLLSSLYPELVKPENDADFDASPVKIEPPRYPREAAMRGVQGWVQFEFDLDKLGIPRNIVVRESFPEKVFTRDALKAVKKWRFKPAKDPQGNPVYRKSKRYTMEFRMSDSKPIAIKEDVYQETLEAAEMGDASSQFNLGLWQLKIPSMREDSNPNSWFLKAAKQGHSTAQYFVGQSLINGEGCIADKTKGIEWLTRSASSGNSLAKQLLARVGMEVDSKESHIQSLNYLEGEKRLEVNSMLDYAWLLIKSPYAEVTNPDKALELVKQLDSAGFSDDATLYEIKAAAYAVKGDFKKAVDLQEEAIDEAEDLNADTELLKANLSQYQSKKVWF
ncbi:MAG: TonB family protein [Kangiellaceae bacterium]|nr:TonB family protein [Kangiellaceae bacterium]MCW8999588.1 TonB family protein [Kangiellaceae bacterium]